MTDTAVVVFLLALLVGVGTVAFVSLAHRGGPGDLDAEMPVRCRAGHVFTTIWVPGVSIKAIRFGKRRYQWCPVGEHRTWVTPAPWSTLSERERRMATHHRDTGTS